MLVCSEQVEAALIPQVVGREPIEDVGTHLEPSHRCLRPTILRPGRVARAAPWHQMSVCIIQPIRRLSPQTNLHMWRVEGGAGCLGPRYLTAYAPPQQTPVDHPPRIALPRTASSRVWSWMDMAFTPIYNAASPLAASRHCFPQAQEVGPTSEAMLAGSLLHSFSIESLKQNGDFHLIQGDVFTQLS